MDKKSSREYGAEGGRKRAKRLTKAELSEIGRKGALARWGDDLPVAQYPGVLQLGDVSFPCAVLSDQRTRVLTETDFMEGMEMYRSGALSVRRGSERGAREPLFLAFKNLKPFIDKHLGDVSTMPFRTLSGNVAHGIRADVIVKICDVWVDAQAAGVLGKRQERVAAQARRLKAALANKAIIDLVDEATGFKQAQTRDHVAEIIDKFVATELRPWVSAFPPEFYSELYRLKGWDYANMRPNSPKPLEVGRLTDDLVYKRLAPFVREELRRLTPRNKKGYLTNKLHQRLTPDAGNAKLKEHFKALLAVMAGHSSFETFQRHIDLALPRYDRNLKLSLNDALRRPVQLELGEEQPTAFPSST